MYIYKTFENISSSNTLESINNILKRNNFKPNETVYVGDMAHDIEAGKKANVKTIAICWGYQSKYKLKKLNPNYIIDNISELPSLIKTTDKSTSAPKMIFLFKICIPLCKIY